MEILAVVRRRTEAFTQAQFDELLAAEAEGVRRLYAQGFIRNAWSRGDVLGACLMLEGESIESARERLQELPLIGRGMADMQLIPLRGYRGFGPQTT